MICEIIMFAVQIFRNLIFNQEVPNFMTSVEIMKFKHFLVYTQDFLIFSSFTF